jgi:PIN domain nuclease of toxin-antitoxin system
VNSAQAAYEIAWLHQKKKLRNQKNEIEKNFGDKRLLLGLSSKFFRAFNLR